MDLLYILLIYGSVLLGLLWSIINTVQILRIKLEYTPGESAYEKEKEEDEEDTFVEINKMAMVESIGLKIEKGAYAFLFQEYCLMTIFVVLFGAIVLVVVDFYGSKDGFKPRFYAFISFVVGSITSMVCGWIGMAIAVKSNYRTTYMAT
jgi:inorganic pyrophosphatase